MNRNRNGLIGVCVGEAATLAVTMAAVADPGGWAAWRVAMFSAGFTALIGYVAGWTFPG